jgi:hypothetical protein
MNFMLWGGGCVGLLLAVAASLLVLESAAKAKDMQRYPPPGTLVDVGAGRRLHLFCKGRVDL